MRRRCTSPLFALINMSSSCCLEHAYTMVDLCGESARKQTVYLFIHTQSFFNIKIQGDSQLVAMSTRPMSTRTHNNWLDINSYPQ